MKVLGVVLICMGAFVTSFALIMSFFSGSSSKADKAENNAVIRSYRRLLFIGAFILAAGILLTVVA